MSKATHALNIMIIAQIHTTYKSRGPFAFYFYSYLKSQFLIWQKNASDLLEESTSYYITNIFFYLIKLIYTQDSSNFVLLNIIIGSKAFMVSSTSLESSMWSLSK